jgi:hypothetical protein
MSDYERAVKQFKMECKEAKMKENKNFALTVKKKRRQKHLIRQTNMALNHIYNGLPMKGYEEIKFRTPARSSLNDEELNFMSWFEPEDRDDVISLPDTVREEFARFEPQIHRLTQQHDIGNITDEEYIAGRQRLLASLEESRYYRDRGAGSEMIFEPRAPDTERPASTIERPMGRIISDPIGEFTYDVPEGPIY